MATQLISTPSDFNTSDLKLKGFKVYEVNKGVNPIPSFNRRDFFKVCINTGENRIQYANKGIDTKGSILFFGNPHIPYSWEVLSADSNGYACVFTEDFLNAKERSESLHESPLFKIGGTPIFHLAPEQTEFLTNIFKRMLAEQEADYTHKGELIRNYITLIIHEALKMHPSENYAKHESSHSRITTLFLELLERQFPVEKPSEPIKLRTPQDFAYNLSIHVNYLNKSVKETTAKSTSTLIGERMISEAKALLQHTDWTITDIAYALGFEYPTYFNNYFKRLTGTTPRATKFSVK